MGDSAGGGITLGLAEKLSVNNIDLPDKVILISPWLDTTMSNEKIAEVQGNDKELNKEKLLIAGASYARGLTQDDEYFVNPINGNLSKLAGKSYAKNIETKNYLVSPLYGEASKLKNVTIFTGTYDILNPDCHLLQEKAKRVGVEIKIQEYETAPHIWIVNNDDELAITAYNDLVNTVNE